MHTTALSSNRSFKQESEGGGEGGGGEGGELAEEM